MATPPMTPKWIVVGQHNNHFHLWKEVHKDIAHQLNELQLVERRVVEIERRMGGLSLQVEGIEVWVAEQEVVGDRVLRLVLWSVGGVLHLMAKVDFLQHCQGHSHPKLSAPLRGSNRPLLASTELAW